MRGALLIGLAVVLLIIGVLVMLFLEPGNVVKKDDRLKTFKRLSGLSSYRFVSMNPTASIESDTLINFDIFLTAFQHRWVADYGADLFYSTISANNKNIIGYSLSTTFDNRNAFGTIGKIGVEITTPVRGRGVGNDGLNS